MVGNKARSSARPGERGRGKAAPGTLPSNVIPLRQRIMRRHTEYLARWLDAGRRMGLCDASAFANEGGRTPDAPRQDYVLVWVRENTDPAYMVTAEGAQWLVIDALRHRTMAKLSTFEAALDFIRPVLTLKAAA